MSLVEWARRHAQQRDGDTVIDDLRAGTSLEEAAHRHGMPRAATRGVQTFYDFLREPTAERVCTGTACWAARGGASTEGVAEVRCLGRCYEAPTRLQQGHFPIPRRALVDEPAIFRHLLGGPPPRLEALYALPGSADDILELLDASGLRGRGGAAYPTGAKWRAARTAGGEPKYVVANGDEGDPGSFVDRLLLEDDPHAVLAGMNACAKAVGATHGVVYIRAEYPRAAEVVRAAIGEAERAGVLVPGFHLTVHVGAGSYVCGEETALLRAIEGLRAEASPKPPYPAERGLFGKPTVVQNVETLAVVPWLLATRKKPSTKAFSLSGAVRRPGAVEAELGISLRRLLEEAGGPSEGARWKMALVGGPMGCVVPASRFDAALSYDAMPGMGHGGVVVLDERVSARALAEHLFAFAAAESCGNCTPCRVGTAQLTRAADRPALARLLDTLEMGSLCGFGQSVPRPIRDLLEHFPDEMFTARPSC